VPLFVDVVTEPELVTGPEVVTAPDVVTGPEAVTELGGTGRIGDDEPLGTGVVDVLLVPEVAGTVVPAAVWAVPATIEVQPASSASAQKTAAAAAAVERRYLVTAEP
jgi:hypothetical protein